jgi:hypothetical protein
MTIGQGEDQGELIATEATDGVASWPTWPRPAPLLEQTQEHVRDLRTALGE